MPRVFWLNPPPAAKFTLPLVIGINEFVDLAELGVPDLSWAFASVVKVGLQAVGEGHGGRQCLEQD